MSMGNPLCKSHNACDRSGGDRGVFAPRETAGSFWRGGAGTQDHALAGSIGDTSARLGTLATQVADQPRNPQDL